MKENLKHLDKLVDPSMITEDSLGNTRTDFEYEGGFSDLEEINERNKMQAVAGAISKEISFMREVIRQQEVVMKYGIDTAKSGKQWEGTPYWSSASGDILISDMGDDHLARIPRHLLNNKVINGVDDLPPNILAEIERRGFRVLDNCMVIQDHGFEAIEDGI